MNLIYKLFIVSVLLMITTASCTPTAGTSNEEAQTVPTAMIISTALDAQTSIGSTFTQITTQNNLLGNHLVDGNIDLQNAGALDIPLNGTPIWLVSVQWNDGAVFVAVMDDGRTQAFSVSGQTYEPFAITPSQLPAGIPPLLAIIDGYPQLIAPPDDASLLTNPLLVNGKFVFVTTKEDLMVNNESLPIAPLPDARILVDENNRLLFLAGPTTQYDHGVLGDTYEASAIALVATEPEPHVLNTIFLEGSVVEGVAPIWADIDNDGQRDIIVTTSNSETGAKIVVFREDGSLLAKSPAIGKGYRWRHQIAVAQFEADKPPLLVSIRTPHIGGIVELLQYENGKLNIVKEIRGFSSHSIGSRNLDSAIAGDFNNDGIVELLAPDQSHENLGVVSLNGVIATLPLNGSLTSNLSATTIDGKIFVGAGTQGNLRVWVP